LKKWEKRAQRQPAITTRMSIRPPEEANESEATRDMPGSRSNVRETAF
jgi:hypothetical protein